MKKKQFLFTIGHSTHSTKEFVSILKAYDIDVLVDIRHYPGSRHCPQFGKARLKQTLSRHDIEYVHLEGLGGRRRPDKTSHVNDGWRSLQFRGYADFMQTDEFKENLKELIKLAKEKTVVIMCSEAVPWRCHRSMVGDALLVHGFQVIDIFNEKNARDHHLTAFAKVKKKEVTYPAEE